MFVQALLQARCRRLVAMINLRIVAPREHSEAALEVLEACASVINVIHLRDAAHRPDGDVIMCDVAREDASVVISDLRSLEIERHGSIAIESIDTTVGDVARRAEEVARGHPVDAVVWEQVGERTSESAALTASFLAFMVLAALIASVGIYLDSPILIVGAMVVGPEFGPVAGFCVAAVQKRARLASESFTALAVGFPVAIVAVVLMSFVFNWTGVTPDTFTEADHSLSRTIAAPDVFAAVVAFCAGIAGMLSLTTAKSGALIGVLISVTTIPAAANVGVAAAYSDWGAFRGSLGQLGVNIAMLLLAGTLTLYVQRLLYLRRRRAHREVIAQRPETMVYMPDEPAGKR